MSSDLSVAESNNYVSVHASAGSGKTFYLVSHIIRLLIQGADPASILAITFTRKAAAEMQQRLLERVYYLATCDEQELHKALSEQFSLTASSEINENTRNLYEKLLHSRQNVRATTFHAFCQDLLRRFPMEADIPPGFELIERTSYLIDEAWNSLSNTLTNNPNSDLAKRMDTLLRILGTFQSRQVLDRFIAARSEWWAFKKQSAFDPANQLNELAQQLSVNSKTDYVTSYLNDELNRQKLKEFAVLLEKHVTKDNQRDSKLLYEVVEQLASGLKPTNNHFESIWSCFYTKTHTPRKRKESKALLKSLGPDGCEEYLQIHEQQCQRLTSVKQQIHAQQTLILNEAWMMVGDVFINEYQQVKRFHRYLDFTDLEWHCYELLNSSDHADWIQYKLDQRINHLLIDEFQDTNPTQWQLVLPLLKELAASEQERHRSVLFVGDSKQSIYRFRRAEPRLFNAASEWIETHLQAKRDALNKSYRSSPAIIDFVNNLFEQNQKLALPDYQTHETVKQDLPGQVCLLPLIKFETEARVHEGLRNPLLTPPETSEPNHYHEGQFIAQQIQQLIGEKIIIGEDDYAHQIDYGDILLLIRNRTHAADYERALREVHIPYLGTERGTLLESIEVLDMVNLLQWLITPFDNHALAGILRSPLFSAKNEDLFSFAGKKNWYEHLLEISEGLDALHPLARAARHLPNWRQLSDTLPVHDLLDRIYSEANLIARYIATYPAHLRSRAESNLKKFIELALENDSGRYPSLTRFLSWLKLLRQQDNEAPDQAASNTQQQWVRILTIHESKGLEAPVVFLMDATTIKRNQGGPRVLIDWPGEAAQPTEFLISPSSPFPNELCQRLMLQQDQKEQQEEVNLLYVAVTRAKQYLYISGSGKTNGWYDLIAQQFSITDIDDVIELTKHNGKTSKPIPAIKQQENHYSVDNRLQQPLATTNNYIEIAPSKLETHSYISATGDQQGREKGNIIHLMLETLANSPETSLKRFCQQQLLIPEQFEIKDYWQQAQQTINQFPEYFSVKNYEQAYSEVPVYFIQNDKTVHGIIDRLVLNTKKATIVDFKTHSINEQQDIDSLAQTFKSQLALYHQGIQLVYPDYEIDCQILFTAIQKTVSVPII